MVVLGSRLADVIVNEIYDVEVDGNYVCVL